MGAIGTALTWAALLGPTAAEVISRLRAQRGEFANKLHEAKKKCQTLPDFEEQQKCKRQLMIKWATDNASTYEAELRVLKQAMVKQKDPEKKRQVEKLLAKTEDKLNFYRKFASILKSTDIPIQTAYEEAKKD